MTKLLVCFNFVHWDCLIFGRSSTSTEDFTRRVHYSRHAAWAIAHELSRAALKWVRIHRYTRLGREWDLKPSIGMTHMIAHLERDLRCQVHPCSELLVHWRSDRARCHRVYEIVLYESQLLTRTNWDTCLMDLSPICPTCDEYMPRIHGPLIVAPEAEPTLSHAELVCIIGVTLDHAIGWDDAMNMLALQEWVNTIFTTNMTLFMLTEWPYP